MKLMKRKLDRVKEIIEPYNIANNKIDDISNKLIDVFKSEVPEVKLLRLLHDNKIGSIKLLYSKAKLKISNDNICINVNNGVLQGSLISPMLFNLYINDLIKELNQNSYEILAYADDLCILCERINQLSNIFKNGMN